MEQVEIKCFFCGRDLSKAKKVNYVAEGPICSVCLMRNNNKNNDDDDLDQFDQVILE